MRLTKFTHACVRIEAGEATVVVDPGSFSEADSVDGATAVLVTHEHPDHLSLENLRGTDAPIFTIEAVAQRIAESDGGVAERVSTVVPGQELGVGLPVRAVGEWHAVIHEEIPRIRNCGYLIDVGGSSVYHPGDALTVPEQDVDLLLAPVCAPWSKTSEVIEFIRAVGAPRTLAIHERVMSDVGLGIVDGLIEGRLEGRDQEYRRIQPGEDLVLD